MQSLDVLLLALSAHRRLKEAAAVLKGRRELADLADNKAVELAEQWAQSLSRLLPSLEFPPYDAGVSSEDYRNARGAAAAMPVAQVSVLQKRETSNVAPFLLSDAALLSHILGVGTWCEDSRPATSPRAL